MRDPKVVAMIQRYKTCQVFIDYLEEAIENEIVPGETLYRLKYRRDKLAKESKELNSDICFAVEVGGDTCGDPRGDICNARIGEEVIILSPGSYEGQKGVVYNKDWGCSHHKGKEKWFTYYEVQFEDGGILTYHHNAVEKANKSFNDETREKLLKDML